ncbi:MAG: 4Fe-4S binding protein [Lachnospiraceae bacterium]|nr:4Fe-4S binding protein [Lachnospiraceae bacterium]
MQTADYLKILKNDIHSAVFATIDENGLPDARVIDIMLVDSDSLYFITAKGKKFYKQLTEQKFAAISGMTGGDHSLDKKAISIRGKIRNIGITKLEEVFTENPYMNEIYPNIESRNALEVFQMYDGQGEYFDLSVKPIYRDTFYLGGNHDIHTGAHGFYVTADCNQCGKCFSECPQSCINVIDEKFSINQAHCLHCGRCYEICPKNAIMKRG